MSEKSEPIRGHVTIEKTGKNLKFQQLLACCTLIVGIVLLFNGYDESGKPHAAAGLGMFANVGGIIWLAVTRARIWWNHG